MKIIIEIETGNAAFEDMGIEAEVGWILQDLSRRINDGLTNAPLAGVKVRDSNGNTVGSVRIEE